MSLVRDVSEQIFGEMIETDPNLEKLPLITREFLVRGLAKAYTQGFIAGSTTGVGGAAAVSAAVTRTIEEFQAFMNDASFIKLADQKIQFCAACMDELRGCQCAGPVSEGCFVCRPNNHVRPPCPPTCAKYRKTAWEILEDSD